MNLTVSDSAFNRIAKLMEKENTNKVALRISVDGGGCSGFMYEYKLVDQIKSDDTVIENKMGIKVVADPLSMQFLKNSKLDFIEELGSSYFQITNPNATTKCGCGNSFGI